MNVNVTLLPSVMSKMFERLVSMLYVDAETVPTVVIVSRYASSVELSIVAVTLPPEIDTLDESCVAIVPRPRFVRAVDAFDRSLRLLLGWRMSPPAAVAKTVAAPLRLIAAPDAELSLGVRESVVPDAV